MPRAEHPNGQMWLGARPSRGATWLLVAVVASFVVIIWDKQLGETIESWFGLIPRYALGTRPWQLLTSALVPQDFGTALGEVFGIWIFGSAVEQRVGTRRMLLLFGAAQVITSLAVAGLGRLLQPDVPVGGCWPATMALLMAFGALYGNLPMRLFAMVELKARTIAWLWMGLSVVVALVTRRWLDVAGDLAGIGVGWVMFSGAYNRADLAWQRWRLKRLRRRYKVIPGGRDSQRYMN
jgi:membrane associated rhomboid family serine protease